MSTQANGLCDPQLPIIYSLVIGNTAAIMQEIMQTQATAQMGLFFPKKAVSHCFAIRFCQEGPGAFQERCLFQRILFWKGQILYLLKRAAEDALLKNGSTLLWAGAPPSTPPLCPISLKARNGLPPWVCRPPVSALAWRCCPPSAVFWAKTDSGGSYFTNLVAFLCFVVIALFLPDTGLEKETENEKVGITGKVLAPCWNGVWNWNLTFLS